MKQTCLVNTKGNEKGIAGQARNDRPFRMKRFILALIFGMSIASSLSAKDKVIVNPVVDFTNTGIIHITKIEVGKDELRMHIHTTFVPHMWVSFSKKDYIEDCATGQKWQATGILNGEFDKEIFMPDSGDSTFVLIFPKLDKTVAKINYRDGTNGDNGGWNIYGISLNPKTKHQAKEAPAEVQTWLDEEVAKSKRTSLMDFKSGEFFSKDTARLVGYIKGYDPRAGFATGMVYAQNVITREDYPMVIRIHEDGRFEGNIPMLFPENLRLIFKNYYFDFYIQPGETMAMLLDWDEFLTADRKRNIRYTFSNIQYKGLSANINKELTTFNALLPKLPYQKIYGEQDKKEPAEYKVFLASITADYTNQYKRLLETSELLEQTRKILQDNYKIEFATFLMEYEMSYGYKNRDTNLPVEFYDFLQNIPMNDKGLLSTPNFMVFINRLEYAAPFNGASYSYPSPEKTYFEYLFEELGIKKSPEDIRFINWQDSINIYLNQPGITGEKQKELLDDFKKTSAEFHEKYSGHFEAYQKKYLADLKQPTPSETATVEWQKKDSIYSEVLKLTPGIVYDITKVRKLDFQFGQSMKEQKEEAAIFLKQLEKGITEPFLKEEAERLFQKNYPVEKPTAYELPDTEEAKLFKEIIAPYKGKYLLVDFWATTCGPCVANIKRQKAWRTTQKDSKDVDFVFITSENESPLNDYNKFVEENELTHTYRLNADDYRYLRQLFRFNGIPRYIIVDREGKIMDDKAQAHHFETNLETILELEKNNQP
jgi:thiol-disulfide isomerase/thioredoxin